MQADSIDHSLGLGSAWLVTYENPPASAQQYQVIPLSVQQDGDLCVVGNADLGEFYQLPEVGVQILRLLESGETVERIKPRLWAADLDIAGFVDQMAAIGFIYPKSQWEIAQRQLQASAQVLPRTFNVDPRIARVCSRYRCWHATQQFCCSPSSMRFIILRCGSTSALCILKRIERCFWL